MKNDFKCTLADEGIWAEFSDFKLLISYDYPKVTWDKMGEILKENGGQRPTWKQIALQAEHVDEINNALKKAGKMEIGLYDWAWSDQEHPLGKNAALCVGMGYGNVYYYSKDDTYYVRAVSAFPIQ